MIINILDQDIIVTILDDDRVQVNLLNPNQQQQSAIEFQDEGITLGTIGTVTKINFVGSSVVASRTGSTVTINVSGGGGSGTVASFSAGNLTPVFTTSVATSTTTPVLSFTLSNQSANTVFAGPLSGAAAAPTFRALGAADITVTDITSSNILKWVVPGLVTTATDGAGLWLSNTTAAAAGVQQISPVITLSGNAWKTTATAGSQAVSFQIYTLPVQGTAAPSASLVFAYQIAAGGYNAGWVMSDLIGATGNNYVAFYDKTVTASSTNFALASIASAAFTRLNSTGSTQLAVSGSVLFECLSQQSNSPNKILAGGAIGATSGATAFMTIVAGTTGTAQLRFTQGVAPTSPNDGECWREDNTNTGLKIRVNGVTKTFSLV